MEACCNVISFSKGVKCPECNAEGTSVGQKTLLNLVKEERRKAIDDGNYYLCATPNCSIIYYNTQGSTTFTKEDLRIRVGLKESNPPIPVCYCFNITEEDIRGEIRKTGSSTASERIQVGIKARGCACEINNPSGRCCLGEVKRVESRVRQKAIEQSGSNLQNTFLTP